MDAEELLRCYAQGQRNFRNTPLVDLDLEGVNLSEASLNNIENTNLKGACLRGTRFTSIKNSNFEGADLSDARFSGTIEDSNFRGTCLSKANMDSSCFER